MKIYQEHYTNQKEILELFIVPNFSLDCVIKLFFYENPWIYPENTFECIQKIHKFKYLFYCLKYKNQFRNWLWDKVRRPKIEIQYHPSRIAGLLDEGVDLDSYL